MSAADRDSDASDVVALVLEADAAFAKYKASDTEREEPVQNLATLLPIIAALDQATSQIKDRRRRSTTVAPPPAMSGGSPRVVGRRKSTILAGDVDFEDLDTIAAMRKRAKTVVVDAVRRVSITSPELLKDIRGSKDEEELLESIVESLVYAFDKSPFAGSATLVADMEDGFMAKAREQSSRLDAVSRDARERADIQWLHKQLEDAAKIANVRIEARKLADADAASKRGLFKTKSKSALGASAMRLLASAAAVVKSGGTPSADKSSRTLGGDAHQNVVSGVDMQADNPKFKPGGRLGGGGSE